MSTFITEEQRSAFGQAADWLIPEFDGMPCATTVEVNGPRVDHLLDLRQELLEPFRRACDALVEGQANIGEQLQSLNKSDSVAFAALSLLAAASYYMDDRVRKLIGYPGQENRPSLNPFAAQEYITNGMLERVQSRGAIYRSVD